jgi:hypothetical protein
MYIPCARNHPHDDPIPASHTVYITIVHQVITTGDISHNRKLVILQLDLISFAKTMTPDSYDELKMVQKYHWTYMNGTDHYDRTINKHSKTHLFEQQLTV